MGPGDEVLTFEPFYDSYGAIIGLSGATHVTAPLLAPDFMPDLAALEAAFSSRTKVVLLNNPHNPTGAVFPREVLQRVVDLAAKHDAVIITDEVYEHLTFGVRHIPVATLPGAAERTVTISSAGKTFSFTGWKIGWLSGPEHLVAAVRTVKQFLSYSSGTPFQGAIAVGLGLPDDFYTGISDTLRHKRDILSDGLRAAGLDVFTPQGTYFVNVDTAPAGDLRLRGPGPAASGTGGRRRHPGTRLLPPRRRRTDPQPAPLCLLQEDRSPRRSRRPAGDAPRTGSDDGGPRHAAASRFLRTTGQHAAIEPDAFTDGGLRAQHRRRGTVPREPGRSRGHLLRVPAPDRARGGPRRPVGRTRQRAASWRRGADAGPLHPGDPARAPCSTPWSWSGSCWTSCCSSCRCRTERSCTR